MKIVDMLKITLDINWWEGYANDPILVVEVGSLPIIRYEALPYEAASGDIQVLYLAKKGPLYVWFLDTGWEGGYYGRELTMPMIDGTTRTIKGPGSSRAAVVNNVLEQNGRSDRVMDISNDAGFRGIDPKWAIDHMPTGTYLKKVVDEPISVPISGGGHYMSAPEIRWIPAKH